MRLRTCAHHTTRHACSLVGTTHSASATCCSRSGWRPRPARCVRACMYRCIASRTHGRARSRRMSCAQHTGRRRSLAAGYGTRSTTAPGTARRTCATAGARACSRCARVQAHGASRMGCVSAALGGLQPPRCAARRVPLLYNGHDRPGIAFSAPRTLRCAVGLLCAGWLLTIRASGALRPTEAAADCCGPAELHICVAESLRLTDQRDDHNHTQVLHDPPVGHRLRPSRARRGLPCRAVPCPFVRMRRCDSRARSGNAAAALDRQCDR